MFDRLKTAWHDPVWSKVIAGAILSVPAVIWTTRAVIVSGVSGALDRATAGLGAAWNWLGAPAQLPHFAMLVFGLALLLLWWWVRKLTRRVDSIDRTAIRGPLSELVKTLELVMPGSSAAEPDAQPQATAPSVAKGFQPNDVQICVVSNLLAYYPVAVSFEQLLVFVGKRTSLHMAGKAHLARELEALEAASVIVKEPSGYYGLTPHGRNFVLDYPGIKNVDEARAAPEEPLKAPAKFEPEKFSLSPLRVRALLALLDGVEARITLHDLYVSTQRYSYEGGRYVDTSVNKGRLQQDMEEAANLGIVVITSVSGGTSRYYALTEQGRNWVLQKEVVLRPIGRIEMRRHT